LTAIFPTSFIFLPPAIELKLQAQNSRTLKQRPKEQTL